MAENQWVTGRGPPCRSKKTPVEKVSGTLKCTETPVHDESDIWGSVFVCLSVYVTKEVAEDAKAIIVVVVVVVPFLHREIH